MAQPVFLYDLASPESYLAAERINAALEEVPEWLPVSLPDAAVHAFRCATERDAYVEDLSRRAAALDLQPLRFPAGWPWEDDLAARAATYAKSIGRAVAFSLAAFRQAYAAGRELDRPDDVLLAAAACEMHPAAVLRGVELRSVRAALAEANERAARAGVRELPALVAPDGTLLEQGDDLLRAIARAIGDARSPAD